MTEQTAPYLTNPQEFTILDREKLLCTVMIGDNAEVITIANIRVTDGGALEIYTNHPDGVIVILEAVPYEK